jgi:hypothetical protein
MAGVEFVSRNLPQGMKASGRVWVLTDLSPLPICQGATDPAAVNQLANAVSVSTTIHLPKLHAKVYIADHSHAIVTSANLTTGGLAANFEYGVEIGNPSVVTTVRKDIQDYAALGALVSDVRLRAYCEVAERVRAAFRTQTAGIATATRLEFEASLRDAEDELIRIRLGGGAVHEVFARTILYLLKRHGPLSTKQIHPLVEAIHPDLCDNSIDRVIDGVHFGKKWKHAVRTAQQILKERGEITLRGETWEAKGK